MGQYAELTFIEGKLDWFKTPATDLNYVLLEWKMQFKTFDVRNLPNFLSSLFHNDTCLHTQTLHLLWNKYILHLNSKTPESNSTLTCSPLI